LALKPVQQPSVFTASLGLLFLALALGLLSLALGHALFGLYPCHLAIPSLLSSPHDLFGLLHLAQP